MEQLDSDVPLHAAPLKVGIVYNLKKEKAPLHDDEEAEYDSISTVYAIRDVFERHGYTVCLLEADGELPDKLRDSGIDIAFNIAEGIRGRGREAEIPAILNLYGIPFTGSDETTLCLALDKALTKRLLRTYHIKTPDYAVCSSASVRLKNIRYPAIVKPNAEGSSKGIRERCVINSAAELMELLHGELETYRQEMLIEEYVAGREFTVGALGNGDAVRIFEPMEIVFKHPTHGNYSVYSFDVKREYKEHIEYRCPSDITARERQTLMDYTRKTFAALGCRDFARMDFRMTEDGEIYFIEANPLPGLAPGYSDYPMLAELCNVSYDKLVLSVLEAALTRYGLEKQRRLERLEVAVFTQDNQRGKAGRVPASE